jgi:hypothetical protein
MEAALSQPAIDEIEIWPGEEADSVGLFLASSTQWRWVGAGMGGVIRTGLDYPAVFAVADRLSIDVTPAVLGNLKVMEMAAVEQWGRK